VGPVDPRAAAAPARIRSAPPFLYDRAVKAGTAIIGGGVMGASIALHAAQRNDPLDAPVVLLERRQLGAGSSGRSGAILRQFYTCREIAAMARDSLRAYATFHRRTGYGVGYRRTGVLTLAAPSRPGDVELLVRAVEMQRSIGVDTRLVEAAEIRQLAPGIRVADGTLGAHEPEGGFVDPKRTLDAFASLARYHGAVTRLSCEVYGIVIEDGVVRGLRSSEGDVACEQVVVAAGPWTGRLLAAHGIDLPLAAVRPQQHFLQMPNAARGTHEPVEPEKESDDLEGRFADREEPRAPVPHPVILDLERGFYTRCEPDHGRTRVGSLEYQTRARVEDPDRMDEHVDPGFSRWARQAIEGRLPVYREQADAGVQAAMYTLTPDSQAIIGRIPGVEGLLVVSGFSGHGFKLAPSVGEGVAQMLHGEPVSAFDPDFFDPARFARGRAHASGDFGL
jgi:sarcosine oxidase, subunit beta